MPRNPQSELFRVVAILPQSRPRYLQSGLIATGFWILSDPDAIQTDCAPIGPDLCPLRLRNPRNWVLGLFAILAQSCELWIDCGFNAILTQFRRIAKNLRIQILTAIYAITLDCNKIAKQRRIARGSKGSHQNNGKSTNCKKTSPIAPELASYHNQSGIRV